MPVVPVDLPSGVFISLLVMVFDHLVTCYRASWSGELESVLGYPVVIIDENEIDGNREYPEKYSSTQ